MRSSPASDQSGAIGLFPFLAVLLCTMGALLVLLVVLAEQAKRSAGSPNGETVDAAPEVAADNLDAPALAERLRQVRRRMAEFAAAGRAADQRLRDQQARLSHLEEHARRLEQELARLYLTHKQLMSAEQDQVVDREQAKRELQRLEELVQQTHERIEKQQQEATGKKSYAIVPYKGQNGTDRRPIYVECTSEGVVIQPEGVTLTEQDFAGPRRPGNPLASAMRAAREYFNSRRPKTADAGDAAPPDPYPLLIVRPGGGAFYNAALRAIRDWDAAFGYEFVDSDTSLEFPALNPRLGQSMQHAVEQARQRQRVLAEIAPNRYGSLAGKFSPAPGNGGADGGQYGGGGMGGSDRFGPSVSGDGGRPSDRFGGSFAAGDKQPMASPEPFNAPAQAGRTDEKSVFASQGGGGSAPSNMAPRGADGPEGSSSELLADGGGPSDEAATNASSDGRGVGQTGGASGSKTQSMADASQAGGAGSGPESASGDAGSHVNPLGPSTAGGQAQAGASGQIGDVPSDASSSSPRGIDWSQHVANRNAVAVRRPVRVVVYADRLAVNSAENDDGSARIGAVVRLDQPADGVMNDLVEAIQTHMQDWGLAGHGMYWRPELVLEVAHGGASNAEKLTRLLKQHHVDLRPLKSAANPAKVESNAAR